MSQFRVVPNIPYIGNCAMNQIFQDHVSQFINQNNSNHLYIGKWISRSKDHTSFFIVDLVSR